MNENTQKKELSKSAIKRIKTNDADMKKRTEKRTKEANKTEVLTETNHTRKKQ